MLHCLGSNAGNPTGPSEEFWEIVIIPSMISSLVIFMSESAFACGCPKNFVYNIVIVGSWMLKTQLYCSFSSSLIFFLFGSRFSSSSRRGTIPALIAELHVFYKFVEDIWFYLMSAIANFLSAVIEIFTFFLISSI